MQELTQTDFEEYGLEKSINILDELLLQKEPLQKIYIMLQYMVAGCEKTTALIGGGFFV